MNEFKWNEENWLPTKFPVPVNDYRGCSGVGVVIFFTNTPPDYYNKPFRSSGERRVYLLGDEVMIENPHLNTSITMSEEEFFSKYSERELMWFTNFAMET